MGKAMRADRAKHHRTRLADRNLDGIDHKHRWLPRCSCGWLGVPAKTKWARQQVLDHKAGIDRHNRIVQRGRVPARARLTPVEDLPEVLR